MPRPPRSATGREGLAGAGHPGWRALDGGGRPQGQGLGALGSKWKRTFLESGRQGLAKGGNPGPNARERQL